MEIELLPPSADPAVIERITGLVNQVYAESEKGLWLGSTDRTSVEEFTGFVAAGEIAAAFVDGDLAGSVRIRRLDDVVGEFGMLAADPARRGLGIGRELVRFAEQTSRDAGCREMQLELLVPRDWTHPSKQFLAEWYGRLGYRVTHRADLAEDYPHLAPSLATPCDFLIYRKELA
ncbi:MULTISPECIES: GNAT family N-acetyltransferase [unclassified Amycolatopsis]|uniref:GNAT family N-acetyltransferase n=1 Tax=unclassified Amycolatopsis TaxID=2618356 RepID=UPI0028743462|nr:MULTISPECIES: GNAT family N-acetyltransferase [unclassified Amycolatopsis]MDS0139743.1 GNAT family N-acetyltransferase [Amycolatopsis sp. 505]MDS0145166.1 GNAT family N-acetyltransferase [Amycolatopsis sp. CM201R]